MALPISHRLVTVLLAASLLPGCAGWPRASRSVSLSRILNAPEDQARATVINVLTEERFQVHLTTPGTRTIIAERFDLWDRAVPMVAHVVPDSWSKWWGVETTLIVELAPVSETQTRVTVKTRLLGRTSAVVRLLAPARASVLPLESNGTLEQRLLERFAA